MPKVYLPSRLRMVINNQSWVEIKATTVIELLSNLTATFPELIPLILKDGHLNHYTRVFVNSVEVRDLDCVLLQNDEIHLIQAMAGG